MTPFEAGRGTGREAVSGSGKEAREHKFLPQLLVFVAIDEAYISPGQGAWYAADLPALVAAKEEAALRGVEINLVIAHYMTVSFFGRTRAPDDIVPLGLPFPSDVAHVIAHRIPREEGFENPGTILQSAAVWTSWIKGARLNVHFAPGSRVVIRLDSSGSMQRHHFGTVPQDTIVLLEAAFPGLETDLIHWGDERWLKWAVEAWDDYKLDHP